MRPMRNRFKHWCWSRFSEVMRRIRIRLRAWVDMTHHICALQLSKLNAWQRFCLSLLATYMRAVLLHVLNHQLQATPVFIPGALATFPLVASWLRDRFADCIGLSQPFLAIACAPGDLG